MKAFIRWIDRFCARHPRFGIYNLMRILVIGNAAVWLLSSMDKTGTVIYYLALYPQMILQGQIWRLITFIFIPPGTHLIKCQAILFAAIILNV